MSTKGTELEEIILDFIKAVENQGIKVEECYLFGSQARNEAGADSDIDLILVSSDFAGVPAWRRWEILGKAVAQVMEPIEALAFTPEEIKMCLQREGNFIRHTLEQPETTSLKNLRAKNLSV